MFFFSLRMRFNQFPNYEISIHTWQLRGTEACEQIYIYLCCDRLFQAQPLHLLLSCSCSFSLWSCHNRLFHASATLPTLFLKEILSVRRQTLMPRRWMCFEDKPHEGEDYVLAALVNLQQHLWPKCQRVDSYLGREEGKVCLFQPYRWALYDSCSQGRIMWPQPHRKHFFFPFFFSSFSDRGRRIEFQVISLVSQDSPRLNRKCNSIPR